MNYLKILDAVIVAFSRIVKMKHLFLTLYVLRIVIVRSVI